MYKTITTVTVPRLVDISRHYADVILWSGYIHSTSRIQCELAIYEKIPDGPKINAEVLRRDGFGEDRLFRCIVAEMDSPDKPQVVGYALYFFSYSTWEGSSLYLEDLYVKPELRGKGIGTALWREVAKICLKKHCVRMDWVCLNWNTSTMDYYKRKGAIDLTADEKWHLFRMKAKEIEAFANEND